MPMKVLLMAKGATNLAKNLSFSGRELILLLNERKLAMLTF